MRAGTPPGPGPSALARRSTKLGVSSRTTSYRFSESVNRPTSLPLGVVTRSPSTPSLSASFGTSALLPRQGLRKHLGSRRALQPLGRHVDPTPQPPVLALRSREQVLAVHPDRRATREPQAPGLPVSVHRDQLHPGLDALLRQHLPQGLHRGPVGRATIEVENLNLHRNAPPYRGPSKAHIYHKPYIRPLFTQVRGRGILRSSLARSCIKGPRGPRGSRLRTTTPRSRGPHILWCRIK